MATKLEYQIVGRYMYGKEVTGYHLQCLASGKEGRFTREQVAFLVGKGQITNCTGQLNKDQFLLRGVGIKLEDLPIQSDKTGELSRTEAVGKIRRGTDAASAMTQFILVGRIENGKNTVGYVIQNAGGATKQISRANAMELASQGRLGNATVQNYQGKQLLRGVNCNLNDLPTTVLNE